jgi:FlaA1/EpsC-like NDP-sugar epimerase
VPRWIIFFFDLSIACISFCLASLIAKNLSFSGISWRNLFDQLLFLTLVNIVVFASIGIYSGIVRYTGLQDALRIIASAGLSTIILFIFNQLSFSTLPVFNFSSVILIIYFTFSFLGLISYRVLVKYILGYFRNYGMDRRLVMIYGAGEAGIATKRVLENHSDNNVIVLAFIDDDPKKINKVVDGVRIVDCVNFKQHALKHSIDELVIAVFALPVERKNEIVDFCLDNHIKVLNVPPVQQWVEGSFSARQLQSVKIEQLLERDSINIHSKEIGEQVRHKRILVTGAAGSIGSEIVRQLALYEPEMIVLCDQAETPLHHLQLALEKLHTETICIPYLADITNETRMRDLFKQFEPHYVYHAAAYKHVPMMEISPVEAIRNNVLGTRLLADLSVAYKVQRFVMISTDKAVNPTNVMGASKRLAEIYVQGLSSQLTHTTKFITTRFGNVLGSNGSVINLFKEQIKQGGPVTVTHPNITRYFMTIPEACQLVLEAGSMGKGGEIFVFDMGKPVTITELAKKMIRLYGLIPGIDISITYTGLRPGEKLYEELLNDAENTTHTYNEKIMIAKVRPVNIKEVKANFKELEILLSTTTNDMDLVAKMKEFVPEFLSNNSVFEALDRQEESEYSNVISINRAG